jgi:hypothetical protein
MRTESNEMIFVGEHALVCAGPLIKSTRVREIGAMESLIPKLAQILKDKADAALEVWKKQLDDALAFDQNKLRSEYLEVLANLQCRSEAKLIELERRSIDICEAVLFDVIGSAPDKRTLNLVAEQIKQHFSSLTEPLVVRVCEKWVVKVAETMVYAGWKPSHFIVEQDNNLEENVILISGDEGGIEFDVQSILSALIFRKKNELKANCENAARGNVDKLDSPKIEVLTNSNDNWATPPDFL